MSSRWDYVWPRACPCVKLDELDRKILEVLRKDGRASYREIARRAGSTTPTVSARIRNLENLGVIQGYRAVIESIRLGGKIVVVLVRCRPGSQDRLLRKLVADTRVVEAHGLAGNHILARLVSDDGNKMQEALEWISNDPDTVSRESHEVMAPGKDEGLSLAAGKVALEIHCFHCGGPLPEKPAKLRRGGRDHYLCCGTCLKLYREKYELLRRVARG